MNKKLLLIGDPEGVAPYHPVDPIVPLLKEILSDYVLEVALDYSAFTKANLEQFGCIISYVDAFKKGFPQECNEDIMSYVQAGGKLVLLHAGISMRCSNDAMGQFIGGSFVNHPKYQPLVMKSAVTHWTMDEEPYLIELTEEAKSRVNFEYCLNDKWYPAGWSLERGRGLVLYMMPGHNAASFKDEQYQNLLRRTLDSLFTSV